MLMLVVHGVLKMENGVVVIVPFLILQVVQNLLLMLDISVVQHVLKLYIPMMTVIGVLKTINGVVFLPIVNFYNNEIEFLYGKIRK